MRRWKRKEREEEKGDGKGRGGGKERGDGTGKGKDMERKRRRDALVDGEGRKGNGQTYVGNRRKSTEKENRITKRIREG